MSLKCHGTLGGAAITRPHVGHSPPLPMLVGFQNRLQSSHHGMADQAEARRLRGPAAAMRLGTV